MVRFLKYVVIFILLSKVVALGNNLNIFLLEMNFDKSTIGLHLLLISSILAKFLKY